ncbi:MAG: autotransporter domain-containing protein, partial [Akkermansia sp.]|nr:autotransporter domain-containing protein [Akkermansia sp.]
ALGSGVVQMSGGCLDVDGQALANDITVQGGEAVLKNAAACTGTLRLQDAALTLSETASLAQATLESSGSSRLSIDPQASTPFQLQHQITNTGHLVLEGSYDITTLAEHTAACLVDATGSINGQSGFVQDAGSRAQLTTGSGTLDATGATILLHGQQVTPDENGSVSLPGALHPDTYTISGEHRVSVSAIRRMAGEQLQRIRMSSGHLLVDSSTSCLQASGGVVQLGNAHLGSGEHGGLEGSTRLEIHGDAVLHGRNTHSGGTHIISGSLRLTDAASLGSGPVLLGSAAAEPGSSRKSRSTSLPVLDLGNQAVSQHLHLQGQSELRGTSHFSGSLTMHPGAEATLSPGSILQLGRGQVLTLSAGGNTLHGQVELAGGTIVLSGGALTLHGVTTISQRTTIDLRQWQGLGAGTPFLQLDYPTACNAELLTLLLPEDTEGLRLHYDPQSGALQLRRGLAESAILAALPSNERRLYQFLISQRAAAQGELQELITTISESEDTGALKKLLSQAGGLCYTSLLPGMQRHALAHAAELRRSAGSGQRLAPGSRTSVGIHVNHHQITQDDTTQGPGYESREWSARLQVEQHLTAHSSLGLALSSGSASITPGRGAGRGASHRDTRTRVDLYAHRRAGRHQFQLGAGLGMHEYELKRQRPGGGSSRVEGAGGRSLTLSGAWDCELSAQQLPGLRSHCSLSTVLVELDAIHEREGGSAAVQVKRASAQLTELSLGLSYSAHLKPELELQAEGAVLALAGDLAPPLETGFAGSPGESCRLTPARQRRYDYRAGLQLSYRLGPQTSLQGGISLQSASQSTHLSLQLHF